LCDADEEPVSSIVNAELDIDSGDQIDLDIEGETASEESSIEKSESQSESETSGANVDGRKEVTIDDKKPNAYAFANN
jgi:hypothetical protein